MTAPFAQRLADIQAAGAVTEADVLAMRADFYADATISLDEAEALIAIETVAESRPQAWADFYVEALSEHVVRQQTPEGYVDQAKADWLAARIGAGGRTAGPAELELLIRILETAEAAPASLSTLALAQAKAAILDRGDGVTGADVDRLRRIVFAFAGAGNIKVTRAEAETLFDLNDALKGRADAHGWTDFFVKAIANAVMAAETFTPMSREEELALEHSLQPRPFDLVRLGKDILHGMPHALEPSVDPDTLYAERNAAGAEARAASEPVDAEEAAWLAARIGRDGTLDGNEKALVAYLKQESPSVHATLAALNGLAA
jgi:hypothetical protein